MEKNIDVALVRKFRAIKSMSFYAGILSVDFDPTMDLIPLCISNTDKYSEKRFSGLSSSRRYIGCYLSMAEPPETAYGNI